MSMVCFRLPLSTLCLHPTGRQESPVAVDDWKHTQGEMSSGQDSVPTGGRGHRHRNKTKCVKTCGKHPVHGQ